MDQPVRSWATNAFSEELGPRVGLPDLQRTPLEPANLGVVANSCQLFVRRSQLHPDAIASAIATPPPRSGTTRLDSLLAGVAEKLADDARLARPAWTKNIPALTEPWEPPGTPRIVARARARAPEQFRRRNIYLSVAELWRSPPGRAT